MNTTKNIIAIIPARGGSKGIPHKNIKLLFGKPLIAYTIEAALKSKYLSRVVVSTENKRIAEISSDYGAEVVIRPLDLAQDNTPSLPVFQHVIKYLEAEESYDASIIVILQPTSPLRTIEDIDGTINKFLESNCDSVVSICDVEHLPYCMYTWDNDSLRPLIEGGEKIERRQDAPRIFRINGAVYITKKDIIIKQNKILGDDTRGFIMPQERSLDIDTQIDFDLAEILLKRRKRA